jgi:ABC-2 type transport system ATP-binding protein
MSKNILEIQDVVKAYDKYIAVDKIRFDMPEGCIFGMLGPNGAGKSSLIRMITTITRPDSGKIYFDGELLNESHPTRIGYMPEERGLYKTMKVGEHLLYLAQLKGMKRADALSELKKWFNKLDILSWWDKKVEELSKGMQQKIQFVATIIHRPQLLILDEPFSGLDPINAELLKNEIDALHHQGTSIIFSTHRMEQVEEICDRIILINKGRNVLEGSVKDIKNKFKENLFEIQYEGILPTDLNSRAQVTKQTANCLTVQLTTDKDSNILLQYLMQNGVYITAFREILPSLNEIFIKQVGDTN